MVSVDPIRGRMARVLAIATCVALALSAADASAAAPPAWTLNSAETALDDHYAAGAQCTPVGARISVGSAALYREFACAVFRGVPAEYLIAIEPASATQLDYVTLHPGRSRPPGADTAGPAAKDLVERVIIVDRANHTIELQDQSMWTLRDPTGELSSWRDGDRITIQPGSFYAVVNLTRKQTLNGSFAGYDS